ncbi:hypothetical protein G6F63_013098 [Rhizopus arrhizus]|nr:hypothetical protein G6F28_013172 [Rhizopus arrhizus]KAG1323172.1 hypothetical protein G6F63_013098 [Rhizopus arrhizus]
MLTLATPPCLLIKKIFYLGQTDTFFRVSDCYTNFCLAKQSSAYTSLKKTYQSVISSIHPSRSNITPLTPPSSTQNSSSNPVSKIQEETKIHSKTSNQEPISSSSSTHQSPVLTVDQPLDFGLPSSVPDWFRPFQARLLHVESLVQENQRLREELKVAQARIAELEAPQAQPPQQQPKPSAGTEASKQLL